MGFAGLGSLWSRSAASITLAIWKSSWKVVTSLRSTRLRTLGRSRAYVMWSCLELIMQGGDELIRGHFGRQVAGVNLAGNSNFEMVPFTLFHQVLASPVKSNSRPLMVSAPEIFSTVLKIVMAVVNSVRAACVRVPSYRAVHWVKWRGRWGAWVTWRIRWNCSSESWIAMV